MVMVTHLSVASNREEFCVPCSALGDLVCRFPMVWGGDRVSGRLQPMVVHPGLVHSAVRPARAAEVGMFAEEYRRVFGRGKL